jgi:D-tagatose-1,6-bisphosphate aldolase subunit GatZ/KbaZ
VIARQEFLERIQVNREGGVAGICSVCSAHPLILEATIRHGIDSGELVLIEATSNQVDQYGGYTGMKPADFAALVKGMAEAAGLPREGFLLGGDHLGPNRWQSLPADQAMDNARKLVAAYSAAGFQKIHLDASMRLPGDPGRPEVPLDDDVVSDRAAELCEAAEEAWSGPEDGAPLYVIGTEVPPPGGAQTAEDPIDVTQPEAARRTVETTREAFRRRGLDRAWERVVALVVQPGLEFGDASIYDYRSGGAHHLSPVILDYPGLVFEAHSTDYQTAGGLASLVRDHFCILKVGPWLTFALREALFGLADMERELLSGHFDVILSDLKETLDGVMLRRPEHWQGYYTGSEDETRFKRRFSFSDRCRYYWPDAAVKNATERLMTNLTENPIPLSLLSQYMPVQYALIREGALAPDPRVLVLNRVSQVLQMYSDAFAGERA